MAAVIVADHIDPCQHKVDDITITQDSPHHHHHHHDESTDSGIISWDDLPGADLTGEEFTEEFQTIPMTPIQPAFSELSIMPYDIEYDLNSLPSIDSDDSPVLQIRSRNHRLTGNRVMPYEYDLDSIPSINSRGSSPVLNIRLGSHGARTTLTTSGMMQAQALVPHTSRSERRRQRKAAQRRTMQQLKISKISLKPETLDSPKECLVCLDTIDLTVKLVNLECCGNSMCTGCMQELISVRVRDGLTYIPCPNPDCTKAFTHGLIAKHIVDKDIRNKYERFRLNTEVDSNKKTCPNCCYITECDLPPFKPKKKTILTPPEYMISCDECSFQWCFNCHSPWHEGLSCISYRDGDKQFMKWTKGRKTGHIPNCQKCPKCKVYIERSSGCDHMTCNQCKSHFCYKCGEKFRDFPGLGDHYSSLSVLGCRYRYLPEQNVKRKVIRGGYLFAKCAAATGFPILLVGGVAVVIAGAVIIVPIGAGIVGALLIRKKIRGY